MKIYLDHAATTPVSKEVVQAIYDVYQKPVHERTGYLEKATRGIEKLIGAENESVYFASGGTEANALAIQMHIENNKHRGKRILISSIEHASVMNTCRAYEKEGYEIVEMPVCSDGVLDIELAKELVTDDTILVCLMYYNNEVGTRQPIETLFEYLKPLGIPLHVDAIQALGKTDLKPIGNTMSFSAHKLNGPKGIGAIYSDKPINRCDCSINEALAYGFYVALNRAIQNLDANVTHMQKLKAKLIDALLNLSVQIDVIRTKAYDHPGIVNVHVPSLDGDALVIRLSLAGISISSGSACSSGAISVSHVLKAMGMDMAKAKRSVRFSIGIETTDADIASVVMVLDKITKGL